MFGKVITQITTCRKLLNHVRVALVVEHAVCVNDVGVLKQKAYLHFSFHISRVYGCLPDDLDRHLFLTLLAMVTVKSRDY